MERRSPATANLLRERLELIQRWYQGMINPKTGMLAYLYIPEADRFVREHSPIRDIASIWDIEVLEEALGRSELRPVVETSLHHYQPYILQRDGYALLDSVRLEEPSSIAHSAFMMLALLHAPGDRATQQIELLRDGILRQQREDGSYKVYFDDLPDSGEELYAGEAMLALLESCRKMRDERCLRSAERGVAYYDQSYFDRGRVSDDVLVFFANWQSQACRLLWQFTDDTRVREQVASFVFRMHDRIIDRGFYDDIRLNPARQGSVEVACALEGLADAYAITRASPASSPAPPASPPASSARSMCTALDYLLGLQCTSDGAPREIGGFGLSSEKRAQRIDITGHAASAFMKCLESGFVCADLTPPPPHRARM